MLQFQAVPLMIQNSVSCHMNIILKQYFCLFLGIKESSKTLTLLCFQHNTHLQLLPRKKKRSWLESIPPYNCNIIYCIKALLWFFIFNNSVIWTSLINIENNTATPFVFADLDLCMIKNESEFNEQWMKSILLFKHSLEIYNVIFRF